MNPIITLSKSSPFGHLIWFLKITLRTWMNSCKTKCMVDLLMANISLHWRYFILWTSLKRKHATWIPIGTTNLYQMFFFSIKCFNLKFHKLFTNFKMFNPSCIIVLHDWKMRIPCCRPSLYLIPKIFAQTKFIKWEQFELVQNHKIDQNMKMFFLFVDWKGNGDFKGSYS